LKPGRQHLTIEGALKLTKFRIETETDTKTGKVYAELYYPDDADQPIASTDPIFSSSEAAEEQIKEMFEEWMSQL
jgi:hypothetical protein